MMGSQFRWIHIGVFVDKSLVWIQLVPATGAYFKQQLNFSADYYISLHETSGPPILTKTDVETIQTIHFMKK